MMANLRFRRGNGGIVLLTILAAVLFAVSPLLLQHHHHAHQQDSAHCDLCLLASGLIVHPPTQSLIDCPRTTITLPAQRRECPPTEPHLHFQSPRSPPVA